MVDLEEAPSASAASVRHWRDAKDVVKLINRVEYLESVRRRLMNAKDVACMITNSNGAYETLDSDKFDVRNAALDYTIRQIADLRHAIKLEYGIESE